MNEFTRREQRESGSRDRIRILFDSEAEALACVRAFWGAMPHGRDLTVQGGDYKQELTSGDRTKIVQGRLSGERGKWVVIIQGNNQPLSSEAEAWLKLRGFTE